MVHGLTKSSWNSSLAPFSNLPIDFCHWPRENQFISLKNRLPVHRQHLLSMRSETLDRKIRNYLFSFESYDTWHLKWKLLRVGDLKRRPKSQEASYLYPFPPLAHCSFHTAWSHPKCWRRSFSRFPKFSFRHSTLCALAGRDLIKLMTIEPRKKRKDPKMTITGWPLRILAREKSLLIKVEARFKSQTEPCNSLRSR